MEPNDTEEPKVTRETTSEAPKDDSQDKTAEVINLFNYKVKKLGDEELVNNCLLTLRHIETGLINTDIKERATQLFNEAIARPSLAFIADDFRVALRVMKHLCL